MNITNGLPYVQSNSSDKDVDYISSDHYQIYYEGDILNLKSVWLREPHVVPLLTIYTCVFLLGIIGNGLVLVAIICSKKTRNVTFLSMFSLAAADLLFVLVCVPIETMGMMLGHWEVGRTLCKVSGFAEMLSASASILNLTTISVERYVVIVMPLKSRKHCTVGQTRRVLVLVWIAASILSSPAAIVRDVAVTTFYNNDTQVQTSLCGEHADKEVLLLFAIYQLVVMFVLPTVIMAYCYSVVIYVLWISRNTLATMIPRHDSGNSLIRQMSGQLTDTDRVYFQQSMTSTYSTTFSTSSSRTNLCRMPSSPSSRTKWCTARDYRVSALNERKQVVKMLVTVVVIFLLCWGPKLILQILKRLQLDFVYYPEVFQAQIGIYCLTYIQSCVNPVIYGLMSKNFRLSLKTACTCIPWCASNSSDSGTNISPDSRCSMETLR